MKLSKGFTLIELIVVMAVFLFVIGAAIGIFLSIVQNQKKILAEQQFLSQISYLEEYVSKALRMAKAEGSEGCLLDSQNSDHPGYIYLLTHYNSGLYQGIKFINQSGNNACQEFFLDTDGIFKEVKNGNPAIAITASSLQINSVRFSIEGSDGTTSPPSSYTCQNKPYDCGAATTDLVQPRVTMLLNVTIPGDGPGSGITCTTTTTCPASQACDLSMHRCFATRTIQTTISQRNLNVQ